MVTNKINIEVTLAFPYRQKLIALKVDKGTSIRDAVEQSNIFSFFNHIPDELRNLEYGVGIFSQEVKSIDEYVLQEGDRIEIYRPLLLDPKQARFKRAAKQDPKAKTS